jgi:uncharacterized protein (TIGR03435 family)
MKYLLLSKAAIVALFASIGHAQQSPGKPEFEAASIKPSQPDARNGLVVALTPGGGLRVLNAALRDLIETAYDVRDFQIIGGPSWAGAARYDVEAAPGSPGSAAEVRRKVQTLLKERFQLEVHRETRVLPVYELVVAKSGIRKDAFRLTGSAKKGINAGPGAMLGEAASMGDLVWKLSKLLGRPVRDNTGLEGRYDFEIHWTPDSGPAIPDGGASDNGAGPSLFTALQQLGLRLQAARGPVDVVVIDRAERPSEN